MNKNSQKRVHNNTHKKPNYNKNYRKPKHKGNYNLNHKQQGRPNSSKQRSGIVHKIMPKAVSRIRNDIGSWRNALRQADSVDNPRRERLMQLYDDIMLDAHLTSQIELRIQHTLSVPFTITKEGAEEEDDIIKLIQQPWVRELNRHILNSIFYGHSLIELSLNEHQQLDVTLIPREHVLPSKGFVLFDLNGDKGVYFRDAREYGTWLLEFGEKNDFGLLNKAVPHVLFKRFAQACWSELCEIYGIPPRYVKTDTQDPDMLDRAEAMLRDMGSAAYFIIDNDEEFQFAKGADTNGDVYKGLINVCKEETSLLINGAVIGQDTEHGNRSKEESSIKLLDTISQADRLMIENCWNNTIIPALVKLGMLSEGYWFTMQQEEDIEKLWTMTKDAMPYMEVDPEWIVEKFGVKVTGAKQTFAHLQMEDYPFFD